MVPAIVRRTPLLAPLPRGDLRLPDRRDPPPPVSVAPSWRSSPLRRSSPPSGCGIRRDPRTHAPAYPPVDSGSPVLPGAAHLPAGAPQTSTWTRPRSGDPRHPRPCGAHARRQCGRVARAPPRSVRIPGARAPRPSDRLARLRLPTAPAWRTAPVVRSAARPGETAPGEANLPGRKSREVLDSSCRYERERDVRARVPRVPTIPLDEECRRSIGRGPLASGRARRDVTAGAVHQALGPRRDAQGGVYQAGYTRGYTPWRTCREGRAGVTNERPLPREQTPGGQTPGNGDSKEVATNGEHAVVAHP